MKVNFKCNIGDTLYYVDTKLISLCEFKINCFKVFDNNITAHGHMYGRYNNKYGYPMDISIKHLDKRIVFTSKKKAKEKLNQLIEQINNNKGE